MRTYISLHFEGGVDDSNMQIKLCFLMHVEKMSVCLLGPQVDYSRISPLLVGSEPSNKTCSLYP